jgi:hypothetical protein
MSRRDNRLAARALADWARQGFTEAATTEIRARYGVARRTLWNWKAALDDDPELAQHFRDRLNDALDQDWTHELDAALREIITRIRALVETETDLANVVAAFEKFSEVLITREVLGVAADARSDSAGAEARRDAQESDSLGPN